MRPKTRAGGPTQREAHRRHGCALPVRAPTTDGGQAGQALREDLPGAATASTPEAPHADLKHNRLAAERQIRERALVTTVHLSRPLTARRAGRGATRGRCNDHHPLVHPRDRLDAQPTKLRKKPSEGHEGLQTRRAWDTSPSLYGFSGRPTTSSKVSKSQLRAIGDSGRRRWCG